MMMMAVISKKIVAALSVLALAGLVGWRACNRALVDAELPSNARVFDDLAPGTSASFVIRGATDLHLVSYYVLANAEPQRTQYSLQLAFFASDGTLREQREFHLSVEPNPDEPPLPDGRKLARLRLLRVSPPANTTILKVSCPENRVLLQAGWLTSRHPSREALLSKSGVPTTWVAPDELQEVRSQRFMRLTQLGKVPVIALPPPNPKTPEVAVKAPEPLRLSPHRAVVWNVIGPGSMEVTLNAAGSYSLDYIGVGGTGHVAVENGHGQVELPAGPSSVSLTSQGDSESAFQVVTHQLRPLEGANATILPSERLISGFVPDGESPLRFPMYGRHTTPLPIRISARALAEPTGPLHWSFQDAEGHHLTDGQLVLEEEFDPFAGIQVDGKTSDLRLSSQLVLVPPKGAAALAISGEHSVVEVDVLLEEGAQPGNLPPYDIELKPGLHFQDAPSRGPRWLLLSPLGSEDEQHRMRVSVVRMPRIEPVDLYKEHGPWRSVEPRKAPQQAQIAEPARHFNAKDNPVTVVATDTEVPITVAEEGANARQVALTCELPKNLGGQLSLLIDGRRVSSAPIVLGTLRLSATTTAGVHMVSVHSPQRGHCNIEGKPAEGPLTVRRKIFEFPEHKRVLQVQVRTTHRQPMRVYFALYSDDPAAQRKTAYNVQIDHGPQFKRVPADVAKARAEHGKAAGELPVQTLHDHRTLYRVTESAVQLGGDLPSGSHSVSLGPLSSFHYWARFWVHGSRKASPKAESYISSEVLAHSEDSE